MRQFDIKYKSKRNFWANFRHSVYSLVFIVQTWMTPEPKTGIVTGLPLHQYILTSRTDHQLMSSSY